MPHDPSPLTHQIGAAVRMLRARRGVSREQLAAEAAVDAQMIKRLESGRGNPTLPVLSRLAAALVVSVSMMLGGAEAAEAASVEMEVREAESEAFGADVVGETIASLRKQRQISQRSLASRLDLQAGTLRKYEAGASDARLQLIEPMAEALGVTVTQFIREIESRQRHARLAGGAWDERRRDVHCRIVSAGERSELWEWRFAGGAEFVEDPEAGVVEEIASVIRGTLRIETDDARHRLRRGASVSLPAGRARRFVNERQTIARVLRFQVRK